MFLIIHHFSRNFVANKSILFVVHLFSGVRRKFSCGGFSFSGIWWSFVFV